MAPSSSTGKIEAEKTAGDTVDADRTNEQIEENKRKAKENLLNDRVKLYKNKTTYDIKKMTKYLMDLSSETSREDDGTSYIMEQCKKLFPNKNDKDDIAIPDLKPTLRENYSKLLIQDLCKEHQLENSEKISYEKFEKSMVTGHKNCAALGYTLTDAIAAVNVLDKTLTSALITIAIIAWLLLTDIATDKILVLTASPFLAATFVFGDTCKKTFEGLIFSFMTHPFDVGDHCIIDGLELEVKRMGIMATTFIRIASKEETLYPNSDLATKSIINLKGDPNPNDRVVLKLDRRCTVAIIDNLRKKINEFFKNDNRFERPATITIEDVGSHIAMAIEYRHVLSIHQVTHSQCYEMKRKQRSEFWLKIVELIELTGAKMAEPDYLSWKTQSNIA